MKMTRDEAIEKFGRSVIQNSLGMPEYKYNDYLRPETLRDATKFWVSGIWGSKAIVLQERLSGKPTDATPKEKWPLLIESVFSGQDKVSDEKVLKVIKGHAVKAYDDARQAVIDRNKPQNSMQQLMSRFPSQSSKLMMGETLFEQLNVRVEYLPDEMEFPDVVLGVNDTVFQFLEPTNYVRDSSITEYNITAVEPVKIDHDTPDSAYDVVYTASKSSSDKFIQFRIHGGRISKSGIKYNPTEHFFLTSNDAETAEKKVWDDIEQGLAGYRQRTQLKNTLV